MTEDTYYTEGVAELVLTLFPEGHVGTCVDVGAYTDKWLSNSYLLEQAGWIVHCIEPNPNCASMLAGRKNVYPYAIGMENKDGVDFFIYHGSPHVGGQASYTGLIQHAHTELTLEVVKVSMRTLDWFMEQYFNGNRLDFLSIDTEETDFDVLRSIDLDRWGVDVVCVENIKGEQPPRDYMATNEYQFLKRLEFNDIYRKSG
ncbi:MAG: FkbM family methyltransferase [Candidatus Thorarchaeota archaeon]|jgi:FkbM family methyltransferase